MTSASGFLRNMGAKARRHPTALALAALAAGAALARPRDRGQPHQAPFARFNAELRRSGPGKPILLLDLDALDKNIDAVRAKVPHGLAVRVVAKSLPSIPLLRHVLQRLETNRLMVFDGSLGLLANAFPEADLLVGKPFPAQAAAAHYKSTQRDDGADASRRARVQWLIDGPERLSQYAALGRELGVRVRVNIEVDIGLHRGGVATPEALRTLLQAISGDPHLAFAGLMGYEPHVAAAPPVLSSPGRALAEAKSRYAAFKEAVRAHDPAWLEGATWNGAGSKTYAMYREDGPANEVALGSALVKPTDFDVESLADHTPAVFIATPVLKRLLGTRVPFLEWASSAWGAWDPNRALTYFVFGGGWLAKPVSPAGLVENPIYGFSTNQAMLNGSVRTALDMDDWVFFRPTQSERVLQEFGEIHLLRDGHLLPERWAALPF
jgi:D-serine deaminase-like pyridoxal phosphate-dependent protein